MTNEPKFATDADYTSVFVGTKVTVPGEIVDIAPDGVTLTVQTKDGMSTITVHASQVFKVEGKGKA
jgi:hypothetical protein